MRPVAQEGFTLIEIMTVVVIISILTGLTTLTIGSYENNSIKLNAQNIEQHLKALQTEAEFQQSIFGIEVKNSPPRIVTKEYNHTTESWQKTRKVKSSVILDNKITLNFTSKAKINVYTRSPFGFKKNFNPHPKPENSIQAAFYPSGELTNFKLTISDEKSIYTLLSDNNTITLQKKS